VNEELNRGHQSPSQNWPLRAIKNPTSETGKEKDCNKNCQEFVADISLFDGSHILVGLGQSSTIQQTKLFGVLKKYFVSLAAWSSVVPPQLAEMGGCEIESCQGIGW
jgi:hypothetical protein